MTTYIQLEKEFNKKVKELRKNCKHKNLGPWCEQYWAIGHSAGFKVRVCKKCMETVMKRVNCNKCENVTEYLVGEDKRPLKDFYCDKCWKKLKLKK